MRILVIFNNDTLDAAESDNSFLCLKSRKSIELVSTQVQEALSKLGFKDIHARPVSSLWQIEEAIKDIAPAIVFNLCESLDVDSGQEIVVVRKLEELGVAFTGNRSDALALALDKFNCNEILANADIAVPESFLVSKLEDMASFNFKHERYIIKPNDEDGSTGIDQCSVVSSMEALVKKVENLFAQKPQRLIIQEYIEGREVNFAFIGDEHNQHWCVSEIIFSTKNSLKNKILCYSSKWVEDSEDFLESTTHPAQLSPLLRQRLINATQRTNQALGIHSYGRLDFKIDHNDIPYVIDVNPNCDLDINAGMAKANRFQGIEYHQLIETIINKALNL